MIDCPNCGMHITASIKYCPKCDYDLSLINRSKMLSIDIAHQFETIEQAFNKLNQSINQAKKDNYGSLRVIVGNGNIKQEIKKILPYYKDIGRIKSFSNEEKNQGAFLLTF